MTMPTMRMTTSLSSEKNSHMTRDRSPIVPIMMPNAMQNISTPAGSVAHRPTNHQRARLEPPPHPRATAVTLAAARALASPAIDRYLLAAPGPRQEADVDR